MAGAATKIAAAQIPDERRMNSSIDEAASSLIVYDTLTSAGGSAHREPRGRVTGGKIGPFSAPRPFPPRR
jgi:hypothetical protein